MIFKRELKYLEMKYAQLATAIEYKSKLNFYKDSNNGYHDKHYGYIYDVIDIDNHIHIVISRQHYICNEYLHFSFIKTKMYLDGICVNQYEFSKELKKGYITTDIWKLDSKNIYHKIPNEVIQKINDWSKNIVTVKNKEVEDKKNFKKIKQKEKYDLEESQLQEIFKEYKIK